MTDKPKRRIRVRRKRRSDRAEEAVDRGDYALDGAEAVFDSDAAYGCCLFEVVLSASVLAALLAVPIVLLIG